jgi:MFS family permease
MLLAPFVGALVDRWDRRFAMIVGDSGAALSTLAVAALLFTGQLQAWHIYIATAMGAAFGAIQRPAYSASVALLIPNDQLGRANGLRRIASSTAELLAPLLAGFLVVAIGIERVILIDVVTFIVAVSALLLVRFPKTPSDAVLKREAEPSLWREALGGWRYLAARPGLRGLTLMYAGTSFLGMTTEVLLTPYVLATNSPDALGGVVSATGVGLLAGGLVLTAWGGPRRRILGILGFEMIVSVCTIVLGLRLPALGIVLTMFIYFIAIALSDGSSESLWQSKVAPDFQGRVFATSDMVALAALPLGLIITAPLAEFVLEPALQPNGALAATLGRMIGVGEGRGIGLIFILTGVINALVVALAWLNPRIRRVEQEMPDAINR